MTTVNIHAAKTHLSQLVEKAAEGEAVVTATLDRDRIARHRESLPALRHRVV